MENIALTYFWSYNLKILSWSSWKVNFIDLRQATFLTSEFHRPVPRMWGRFSFHITSWSNSIQNWSLSWALRLESRQSLCWSRPHTFIYSKTLVKLCTSHKSSCFHMLWKWTTPWFEFQKSVEYQLQDTPRRKCAPPLFSESQSKEWQISDSM